MIKSWSGFRQLLFITLLAGIQACTFFSAHIDKACVKQFANYYPQTSETRFILPW